MPLTSIFDIAAAGMTAQSQRLNVVASNLANADSATSASGEPYRARQVVFSTVPASGGGSTVQVTGIKEDPSPLRLVYDPKHPLANKDGYVSLPNVNVVDEMVNMIAASRSYQNDVEMMNTVKTLMLKTLSLGQ
jgi:flagellar basal-body rod protein FlgC